MGFPEDMATAMPPECPEPDHREQPDANCRQCQVHQASHEASLGRIAERAAHYPTPPPLDSNRRSRKELEEEVRELFTHATRDAPALKTWLPNRLITAQPVRFLLLRAAVLRGRLRSRPDIAMPLRAALIVAGLVVLYTTFHWLSR